MEIPQKPPEQPQLESLFRTRKWALLSAVLCVFNLLLPIRFWVANYVLIASLVVFSVASMLSWFYMFRIVRTLHGVGYALAHVAISVLLTPVFLFGLILVPLLVQGDAERLAGVADTDQDDTIASK